MISLIHYDEFGKGMGFPSLKDSFLGEKYEGQDKIIKYLLNGKTKGASTGHDIDIVTGETITMEKKFMTDGIYSWTSTLIYYIEKYNLRLDKDFEKYVFNK